MKSYYDKFDMYGLRHLPIHLIEFEDLDTLEAVLCDLFFIGAKCAAGMTMNLIDDFNAAVASLDETQMVGKKTDRLDKFRIFGQFVQSEANQFAKHLKFFPTFCIQQAYNSARSGPVVMEAKKVINELKTSISLLRYPRSLPRFNSHPSLLRTIDGYQYGDSLGITLDGRMVISGGTNNDLKVWDIHSGRLIKSLEGGHEKILSVSITPDGKYALTGSNSVRLWDLENNICLREFKGNDDNLAPSVVISSDGRTLLSGGYDKTIRLWNSETGECDKIFIHPFLGEIYCLCLSPDGESVISGGENGIVFWDIHTGKPTKSYRSLRGKRVPKIQIIDGINSHEDDEIDILTLSVPISGMIMVSGDLDGIVRIWDIDTDKCIKELNGHTYPVNSVAVTPCGKIAVSGSWDKTVKVWNLEAGRCLKTLHGHSDQICAVAVNADGTMAISGSFDQIMKIWNIKDGKSFKFRERHKDEVLTVKITADGKFVISGSCDKTLRIWDIKTGRSILKLEGHCVTIGCIQITPDGKNIIAKGTGDTLKVWDRNSGECKKIIEDIYSSNYNFELTPDGEIAIDAGGDGKFLKVLKVVSGECLTNLKGHSGEIRAMSLTPDGRLLVAGGADKALRVWDIQTGNCLNVLEGHSETIIAIKITADGRVVISGSVDKTLRIWDIFTGKCLKVLEGHTNEITSVYSEQSGRLILTASADETWRVWDIRTGNCTGIYRGNSGYKMQAEILIDGGMVISGGAEETIHIWDIKTTECLGVLNHHNQILSLAANNNRIVIGDPVGNVTFYRLYGLDIPYAITNSVRLWNYENYNWDKRIISTCHWCGIRFPIPQKISAVIKEISKHFNLSDHQSPCLGYPDEAWEVPELISQCPGCKRKLKFNPFIVDNKKSKLEMLIKNTANTDL